MSRLTRYRWVLIVFLLSWGTVAAQPPSPRQAAGARDQGSPEPAKPAKPENVLLQTEDRVLLRAIYFAGTAGKKTVPVILLHGWEGPAGPGSAHDMFGLALLLQSRGHAVIAPDLRGHGRTTARHLPSGQAVQFERSRMRSEDLADMVRFDLEAVKKFLLDRHNAGELNIEMLCVVGAEMGAVVALNWAHLDWSIPSLPTLKQGQDVKALVLISPDQSFKGYTVRNALANPVVLGQLPTMIIYGKQAPEADGSRRLYNVFRRAHRAPADEAPNLELAELDTSLTGAKLLASRDLKIAQQIAEFLEQRIAVRRDRFAWRERAR